MKKFGMLLAGLTLCLSTFAKDVENKKYNKIVVLDPAVVETIYMLGGESSIAAIADTAMSPVWPFDKTKALPKVGAVNKPSFEQIISFEPDLVVVGAMSTSVIPNLEAKGISYIEPDGTTFENILDNIKRYGIYTGQEAKAEELYNHYVTKLEDVKKEISEKPLNRKGAILYSTSPLMAFNSKSLPGQIFNTLGIKNIADNLPGGKPILSTEYIITQNPDLILGAMSIKSKDDILNSTPIMKDTAAAKRGDIFILDSSKMLRPTPRVIDALVDLYQELKVEKN